MDLRPDQALRRDQRGLPVLTRGAAKTLKALAGAVVAAPPRCAGNFAVSHQRTELGDGYASVGFTLRCRTCGGGRFAFAEVTSHWTAAGGPQQQTPSGVVATCAACGAPAPVFSALSDGYDGELGRLKFLQGPTTVSALGPGGEAVISFTYNADPAELEASAAEAGVRAPDLFDWFTLETRSGADQPFQQIWDYECA